MDYKIGTVVVCGCSNPACDKTDLHLIIAIYETEGQFRLHSLINGIEFNTYFNSETPPITIQHKFSVFEKLVYGIL